MKAMPTLSVAIVAKNEAANLGRTLDSVLWADEIVVVDSGSTDGTIEIARARGATIYEEPWRGYGGQVNRALDLCRCPWILNLDADEVLSTELSQEIRELLQTEPPVPCYTVSRLNLVFGRWMRHGGLYPDRKLRLFRKGSARLREDTEPHATPKTTEPVGALQGDLLHYAYPTLSAYIEHINRYSSASVPLLRRKGRYSKSTSAFVANMLLNPLLTFTYNYLFRAGFLDGKEGLLFHLNHSLYVQWKYAKVWEHYGRAEAPKLEPS